MFENYNINSARVLNNSLDQFYNAIRMDDVSSAFIAKISDKEYSFKDMDKCFHKYVNSIHAYNTLAFSLNGKIHQHNLEILISGGKTSYFDDICISFTEYGLIDYIAISSFSEYLSEDKYRDFVYRQFYSFFYKNEINPFSSAAEMFNFIVEDRSVLMCLIKFNDREFFVRKYTPVLSDKGKKMYDINFSFVHKEEDFKIKNTLSNDRFIDHYSVTNAAYEINSIEDYVRTSGYDAHMNHFSSRMFTEYKNNTQIKKEDTFFEGIFDSNPFFSVVEEKINSIIKPQLHLA